MFRFSNLKINEPQDNLYNSHIKRILYKYIIMTHDDVMTWNNCQQIIFLKTAYIFIWQAVYSHLTVKNV